MEILHAHDVCMWDIQNELSMYEKYSTESEHFDAQMWNEDLPRLTPALTDIEQIETEKIRQGYLHSKRRIRQQFHERTVHGAILDPLLWLCGLYSPPFHVDSEVAVTYWASSINPNRRELKVSGVVDKLVCHGKHWVLPIEVKKPHWGRGFPQSEKATTQLLAYMASQLSIDDVQYGLVTNGNQFLFTKTWKETDSEQAFYDPYVTEGLSFRKGALDGIVGFLKYIRQVAVEKYGSE